MKKTDMRLGQILINASPSRAETTNIFFYSDEAWAEYLQSFRAKCETFP